MSLVKKVMAMFAKEPSESNTSDQILELFEEYDRGLTANEICDMLDVSRQTLCYPLQSLQADGRIQLGPKVFDSKAGRRVSTYFPGVKN